MYCVDEIKFTIEIINICSYVKKRVLCIPLTPDTQLPLTSSLVMVSFYVEKVSVLLYRPTLLILVSRDPKSLCPFIISIRL